MFFKKFFSRVSTNDGENDISNISNFEKTNIFKQTLSKEIIITIGTYLQVRELNNLSRCDKFLLDLFFNLTTNKIRAISIRKEELKQLDMESRIVSIKDQYMDEESGDQSIQRVIWRPLVLYHFPNYSKTVNIKNWMHVLRRRVIHLQNQFPHELPLSKIIEGYQPSAYQGDLRENSDRHFIENCEWEYECPLKSNAFETVSKNVKFCKVCKENVYEVFQVEDFKMHVQEGHCVAFSRYETEIIYRGKVSWKQQ